MAEKRVYVRHMSSEHSDLVKMCEETNIGLEMRNNKGKPLYVLTLVLPDKILYRYAMTMPEARKCVNELVKAGVDSGQPLHVGVNVRGQKISIKIHPEGGYSVNWKGCYVLMEDLEEAIEFAKQASISLFVGSRELSVERDGWDNLYYDLINI